MHPVTFQITCTARWTLLEISKLIHRTYNNGMTRKTAFAVLYVDHFMNVCSLLMSHGPQSALQSFNLLRQTAPFLCFKLLAFSSFSAAWSLPHTHTKIWGKFIYIFRIFPSIGPSFSLIYICSISLKFHSLKHQSNETAPSSWILTSLCACECSPVPSNCWRLFPKSRIFHCYWEKRIVPHKLPCYYCYWNACKSF